MLLDTYAPHKRIDKYMLQPKSKPQITLGLQKIFSYNKLLIKFIIKKNPKPYTFPYRNT